MTFPSSVVLQLAKNVGNSSFNEIMEGNLPHPSPKPTPSSDMSVLRVIRIRPCERTFENTPLSCRTVRKEFITAKYVDHKYAKKTCTSASAKMIELFEAVQSRDLLALIQVYAEGVELMEPLPETGPVSLTASFNLDLLERGRGDYRKPLLCFIFFKR